MDAHIYCVTNILNDKQYVGQTTKPTNKIGHGKLITRAYNLYSKRNFVYEKLFTNIDNRNLLNYAERFWIKVFDTLTPHGYNIDEGGNGQYALKGKKQAWNKGLKTPEDVVHKLRLAKIGVEGNKKGKKLSEESKKRISDAKKGTRLAPEVYARQAAKRIGFKHEKVTCPHCGKTGGASAMPRWHMDNCKEKV